MVFHTWLIISNWFQYLGVIMKSIGICGHFGGNKNFLDGQTVKTKIVTKELEKEFGNNEVKKVDTFGGKRRLVPILLNLISLVVCCKNIIILPAHNSLRIFAPLLAFMNNFYHRKLHYVVIGGWLPEFVATRKWLKNALMKFAFIYVETSTMKNQLEAMGFTNIVQLPNCKDLNVIRLEELVYTKQEPFKVCTFSRVMKEKGMSEHKAREEWEYVEKSQHARHEYITGKKRGDRHTRDMLINSSILGWDETTDMIIDMIDRKFEQDDAKQLKKEA